MASKIKKNIQFESQRGILYDIEEKSGFFIYVEHYYLYPVELKWDEREENFIDEERVADDIDEFYITYSSREGKKYKFLETDIIKFFKNCSESKWEFDEPNGDGGIFDDHLSYDERIREWEGLKSKFPNVSSKDDFSIEQD